nr:hypothetical protein [uncultured bacterium]
MECIWCGQKAKLSCSLATYLYRHLEPASSVVPFFPYNITVSFPPTSIEVFLKLA